MHHSTEKGTQMSNQSHTIGSLLHRFGVAGPARARALQGIGALIAVLGSLVFATAPAQAAIAHKYISQLTGAPAGSFSDGACGVTVDPATQDVYVVDPGNDAIDIFEPAGAGAYTYKSQISGTSVPTGSFDSSYICNLAVSDVTGDVYLASADPELPENHEDIIYVFNALGTWVETLSPHGLYGASENPMTVDQSTGDVYIFVNSRELDLYNSKNEYQSALSFGAGGYGPEALTTNSSGDVYGFGRFGSAGEGNEHGIYEFNSSGSLIAEIPTPQDDGGRSKSLAVDSAGDFYLSNGDEFSPSGELEGQTRGEIAAVDSSNDLVVVEAGSPSVVDIYGPGVVVPGTTVQAPSSLGSTVAVASGSVNPAGVQVESCEFEYGTSTSYGQSMPCEQTPADIGSGTSPVPVTATLGSLQSNTTYYYRLNAANIKGNANEAGGSGPETFTTPGIPKVVSESAEVKSTEKAGQSHATLTAQVTPDGRETTYQFEYGETESYGTSAPVPPGVLGSGYTPVLAATELSGLKLDTTYHYRVVASNECEVGKTCTAYGPDQAFTTVAAALVEGSSVSKVTATSATLDVQVDPLDTETSAYFQYGMVSCAASPASCTDAPIPPGIDVGSAEGYQAASEYLRGLAPSTTYYYRVIATNEFGTIEGEHNEKGEEVVHTFTTQAPGSTLGLPDDRQWELVSPPAKHGALIEPIKEYGVIQAAANGDAITYITSSPTETEPRANSSNTQALSTRSADGWSSQDITSPTPAATGVAIGHGVNYVFFSSDLSRAIDVPEGEVSSLTSFPGEETSPEATERTDFLRQNSTCQETPATCYTPLLTSANVTSGRLFGSELGYQFENGGVATPDLSHVILESGVPLTKATATAPEAGGLYEWTAGKPAAEQLQLVSVLPESEGGRAASGPVVGSRAFGAPETRHAISEDGSRVVFSEVGGDHGLYMRDTVTGETVRLDTVQQGASGEHFPEPQFDTASSDGSMVFFTDMQRLTADSRAAASEPDLYVCQMVEVEVAGHKQLKCDVTDLTPDSNPDGERAHVVGGESNAGGVLDAGEDGSYVYFVADGVLGDGAEHGATRGGCSAGSEGTQQQKEEERCNLYVEHYNGSAWEAPRFIAALSGEDQPDWWAGNLRNHTSRSSPDGRYLAFMSERDLTGYDTTDVNESTGRHLDEEVYLYDAVTGKLVCASCNPTGGRPDGMPYTGLTGESGAVDMPIAGGYQVWWDQQWLSANVPGGTPYSQFLTLYQSRYLSNSGRLFFNSHEGLVPQDVNGTWDVYEYEPSGAGTCTEGSSSAGSTYVPGKDGCIGLISSGTSSEESAFLDASENGGDVFFMTTSQLVPQDVDHSYDVYDAHECTSESPCPPTPAAAPPVCTTEASCKPAPEPQPGIYGPPPSATFAGPGNVTPEVTPPPKKVIKKTVTCKKGFTRNKKSKCVRKRSEKRAKKSSKSNHGGKS
jgi:hypothetical protein